MIKKFIPLSLTLILIGCQSILPVSLTTVSDLKKSDSPPTSSVLPSTNIQTTKLNFKEISKDREKLISMAIGQNNAGQLQSVSMGGTNSPEMAKTVTAPSMAAATPVPNSNLKDNNYSYGFTTNPSGTTNSFYSSIWRGWDNFDEYILDDVKEATMEGFVADFNTTVQKITPYVKGWASDARLIDFNGYVDNSGKNLPQSISIDDLNKKYNYYPILYYSYPYKSSSETSDNNPPIPGWQFNYVSSSRKEKLTVIISSKESLFIKQKWVLKDLAIDNIKINSDEVIKKVKEAIKNPDFKPEPDPDTTVTPITPYWEQYDNQYEKVEIINNLPEDSLWTLYLYKEITNKNKKIVWNVNINIPIEKIPESSSTPNSPVSSVMPYIPQPWIENGYAKVDATTGKILELKRPVKHTPKQIETPKPIEPTPTPTPVEPTPTPTPTPVEPTPTLTPIETPIPM